MTDPSRPATLTTVAKASGVHPSTVSRALKRSRNLPANRIIRPEDQRILEVAKSLGYIPNHNAASLITRRSTTFGVLVPRLTDFLLSSIYDAIEYAAHEAGYETFVANTHDDHEAQRRRADHLLSRSVDGLIIADARRDGSNLTHLVERNVPHVLVARVAEGHLSVSVDDHEGGWLVGNHLADLGHERIGVVAADPTLSTSFDRISGLQDALAHRGIELPPENIVYAGFDVLNGKLGAQQLLERSNDLTAIFAVNDLAAIGVLGELRDRSIRPAHDIAVVGYNDLPVAGELAVPLTTISSPMRELGQRSVEALLALINNIPVSSVKLRPRLIVRATSVPSAQG